MATQLELSTKLAEIGAQLRQVRENKELTLEEIQASTLISKSHLQAIEEGNLERLPELVYVQGFIRKYGQAIGMVEITAELPSLTPPSPPLDLTAELRPWHLYGVYVTIVIASVSFLAFLFREPLAPLSDVPVTLPAKEAPAPVAAVSPLSPTLAVNVGVEMVGESWMRVIVDGNLDFEGIMVEGTVTQWSGNEEIVLRAGNAAAVRAKFQENTPQILGSEGEVVELIYSRDRVTPQP